jgi:hypothetical protein
MFKLAQDRLTEIVTGIPVGDLPRTFADALQVARRLQVRYIWIGSLCIIQDSVEDWQTESVQMQKVCTYSLLNLLATGAGNSS